MTGSFRLVRLRGRHGKDEWPLSAGRETVLGRRGAQGRVPDVDLSVDRHVSRSHARIWFADNSWWLEDLGSKHGTRVASRPIEPKQPVRLDAGVEIELGRTWLSLFPPHWHRLNAGDLVLEIGVGPAVNAALHRGTAKLVPRLVVRNQSTTSRPPAQLVLSFANVARATLTIPPLDSGEVRSLAPPDFVLDPHGAPVLVERAWRPLVIEMNGAPLRHGRRIGAWVLAHNEWPFRPENRGDLAAFIMPNHPAVTALVRQALEGMSSSAPPQTAFERLYNHLHDSWRIDYRYEPPGYDSGSQKIRLPHQLLADVAAKKGHGTCLDLALLLAACLEAVRLQPLVAIIELGRGGHALAGCWRRPTHTLEPVITDREPLLTQAVWVDPNGCTRDPAHRSSFADAEGAALEKLRAAPVFAVDVGASRLQGVTPLPFAGEPQWSAPVEEALVAAAAIAEDAGVPLAVLPLLIGLLRVENGLASRLFRHIEAEPPAVAGKLAQALRSGRRSQGPSRHYREALALAKVNARAEGSMLVQQQHMLAALLACHSAALDDALTRLGTDRASLQSALERFDPGRGGETPDASVFLAPQTK
jgi:hypothetical protein